MCVKKFKEDLTINKTWRVNPLRLHNMDGVLVAEMIHYYDNMYVGERCDKPACHHALHYYATVWKERRVLHMKTLLEEASYTRPSSINKVNFLGVKLSTKTDKHLKTHTLKRVFSW